METMTLTSGHGFRSGDVVFVDGVEYGETFTIKKIVSSTTLELRKQYWFERLWRSIRVELVSAFEFLFI